MKTKLKLGYGVLLTLAILLFVTLYIYSISATNNANRIGVAHSPQSVVFVESLSGNFLAANYLFRNKNALNAATYYKKALAMDTTNSQILLDGFYISSILQNSPSEALQIIKKYRSDPSTITGNIILGLLAIKEQKFDLAITLLQKPTEIVDFLYLNEEIKNLLLSLCYIGKGDYNAAQDLLKGNGTPNEQTRYFLALLQDLAKFDQEAEANLTIVANKRFPEISVERSYLTTILLSNLQYRHGKQQLAKDTIINFIRDYPFIALGDESDAELRLINTPAEAASFIFMEFGYLLANKPEIALICLQVAHDLNPASDIITRELAAFYEYTGNYVMALEYYQKISTQAKFYTGIEARIALNKYLLGDGEEAISKLTKLNSAEAKVILAEIYRKEFLFSKAIETYNSILAQVATPGKPYMVIYELKGDCYSYLKDYVNAKKNWQNSLLLQPGNANLLNKMGYTELQVRGDLKLAYQLIKQALDQEPGNPAIIDSYGYALYLQNKYQDAIIYLEQALNLMPESYEVCDHLGDAYSGLGNKAQAKLYWSNARDLYVEQVNLKLSFADEDFISNINHKLKQGLDD